MRRALPLFGLFLLGAPGCVAGTPAAEGYTYVFRDLSPAPIMEAPKVAVRPVVVGGTAIFGVRQAEDNEILEIGSVASNNENVLFPELMDEKMGMFTVVAKAPGEAKIVAAGYDGKWQSVEMKAARAVKADVLLLPIFPHVSLPRELTGSEVGILPNEKVWLLPGYRDAEDNRLTGWGVATWSAEGAGHVVNEDQNDFGEFRNAQSGDTMVRFGDFGELKLATVQRAEITALSLYDHRERELFRPDETIPFKVGRLRVMHLVARTADGRYVVGAYDDTLDVVAAKDKRNVLRLVDGRDEPPDEDTATLLRQLAEGRGFMMGATYAGDAEIEVTWAGQSARWRVHAFGE